MTHRAMSAIVLGVAVLIVSCARSGSESATRPNSNASTTSTNSDEASTVAPAATTATPTGEPDPFEMTAPPPPADPNGPCVLGRNLGGDGNVAGAGVSFARNDLIYLTVRPKQSLKELTVDIADHMGKRMQTFSGPLKSEAVTYHLSALPHGRYRVIAYGGPGLPVCELRFEVR